MAGSEGGTAEAGLAQYAGPHVWRRLQRRDGGTDKVAVAHTRIRQRLGLVDCRWVQTTRGGQSNKSSSASSVMVRMGGNRWEKKAERWEEKVSGYGPGTCNSKKFSIAVEVEAYGSNPCRTSRLYLINRSILRTRPHLFEPSSFGYFFAITSRNVTSRYIASIPETDPLRKTWGRTGRHCPLRPFVILVSYPYEGRDTPKFTLQYLFSLRCKGM